MRSALARQPTAGASRPPTPRAAMLALDAPLAAAGFPLCGGSARPEVFRSKSGGSTPRLQGYPISNRAGGAARPAAVMVNYHAES
jgi:hypothetical protein